MKEGLFEFFGYELCKVQILTRQVEFNTKYSTFPITILAPMTIYFFRDGVIF